MKNITSLIIVLSFIFAFLLLPAFADNKMQKATLSDVKILQHKTVFRADVTESKELPSELYGVWLVSTKLIRTDNINSTPAKTFEFWQLEEIDGKVTLSNPTTGANATITVDNVKNNTAIFSRHKFYTNKKEFEQVTLTIYKNNFIGKDVQTTKSYNKGQLLKTEMAEYEIKGTRINNSIEKELFSQ